MLFEWSDHSHVTFTQWQTGEPSHATNLQEDCVLIRGKVTPITHRKQTGEIIIQLYRHASGTVFWHFFLYYYLYRMGGGQITCVKRHMGISVRRGPPLNHLKVFKRKPILDAS